MKIDMNNYQVVAKEKAKAEAAKLQSVKFPVEHVEKALEFAYREGFLDGAHDGVSTMRAAGERIFGSLSAKGAK